MESEEGLESKSNDVPTHPSSRRTRVPPRKPSALEASHLEEVPLSDIDPSNIAFQIRVHPGFRWLKASLAEMGQEESVHLMAPKPYRILDGFGRIGALLSLGKSTVRAIVHPEMTGLEALSKAFHINRDRKNPSPLDCANAIRLGRKLGYSDADLMVAFGLSARSFRRYAKLLAFPLVTKKALDAERITMAQAKVLADYRPRNLASWITKAASGMSAPQLGRALRRSSGMRTTRSRSLKIKGGHDWLRIYPVTLHADFPRVTLAQAQVTMREAIAVLAAWLSHTMIEP